jgi:F1F0 ATPase subunit 2
MIELRILGYGALGALTALIYVSALGWNVRLYLDDRARWSAVLVHLARMVVVAAAFTLCALQGALALLSSLAGFQIVRTVAVRRQTLVAEKTA